jgi:CRISPR type I-E-associated protein CasA/Cse1
MNDPTQELQFNALTGAWLPLVQRDGSTVWGSPIEVLCGEKDGIDLDYPRDDFRVYARLLLSALTQALFPAKNVQELKRRLAEPLVRGEVEARVAPVLSEFDLFGRTPFLQISPPNDAPTTKGAAPFVFGLTDLYTPRVEVEAVSLPIALVTTFIEQTYAGGAGRGYGAGPGGQPGAFTLIDEGTVRGSAWANTLTLEGLKGKYAPDPEDAWSNAARSPKPRAATGLVEGLFFQPRGIWLIAAGEGRCSFTGRAGALVRLSPFLPKSELTKKPATGEDVWVHPCAPMAVNSQGIAAIRLNAERPVWTGLAQLLAPLSARKGKIAHPLEGPAPVLAQWKDLKHRIAALRLIVLDFVRDKANIKRRFFESFSLTSDLVAGHEFADVLRALVGETQEVASALEKALVRAHDDRRLGGLALAEARTAFWSSTEAPFMDWWATVVEVDHESDAGWSQLRDSRTLLVASFKRTALSIFNDHAEVSEFDPRKQKRVALARRTLIRALWQSQSPASVPTQPSEVRP